MKLCSVVLFTILAIISTSCNITLAEDVTPPPDYVAPTPAPTLGPLVPAQAPSVENGAAIYVEKCAPCHGDTGLGDGEQGIQLGVTVPAFGLPEIARPASLAQWYVMVTRGNLERFMPPFRSLSDQERWDVVAYAMTLHTTEHEIEKGKQLFEANCANCSTEFFKDQEKMSALNEVELARIITVGNDEVKAFGADLSEDDVWAVAAYLRTLPFAAASVAIVSTPLFATEPATASQTLRPAEETPIEGPALSTVEGTVQPAAPSEAAASSQPGFGMVSGSVENRTGAEFPTDLKITLRGFDSAADPNATPQEVLNVDGVVDMDGSFAFENVEIPPGRIFLAQLTHTGLKLQSEFAIVEEAASTLTLSPIILYGTTDDVSGLVMDDARIFFNYAEDEIRVLTAYSFRNLTDKIVVVESKDGLEIPFIKVPNGAQVLGFQAMEDSQPFTANGSTLAFAPSEQPYGLIVFSTLVKNSEVEVSQPFAVPVTNLAVYVTEGVKANSTQLTDHGVQPVNALNFQMYATGGLNAGDILTFTLSGTPRDASAADSEPSTNQNLLVGAGALGIALIIAGAWLYIGDRFRTREDVESDEENQGNEDDDFETPEDVMDSIIALDDLKNAKKIPYDAYQKRRAELKERLREEMEDLGKP
ncbi:MAG: c-type cytochrome [Chloroflexota bacterium]|nr:c-type cytochrome [Chloroflexota bacterium]